MCDIDFFFLSVLFVWKWVKWSFIVIFCDKRGYNFVDVDCFSDLYDFLYVMIEIL